MVKSAMTHYQEIQLVPCNTTSAMEPGNLAVLRKATLISILAGAGGSACLTLYAGRPNDSRF